MGTVKQFVGSFYTMIVASVVLYLVGYIIHQPLLMIYYEQQRNGYIVETGGSVLPLLIGSLLAMVAHRMLKTKIV